MLYATILDIRPEKKICVFPISSCKNLILTTNIQHIKVAHNLEHRSGITVVAMLYNLSTHTLEYLKYYNVLSAFPLTKQILTQWFRAEPVNI